MNKLFLIPILAIIFVSKLESQNLTLSDLLNLQKKDIEYINNFLTNNRWSFYSSENDTAIKSASWHFGKEELWDRDKGIFYLTQRDRMENSILYYLTKEQFTKLKDNVISFGFEFFKTEITDNGIESKYRNKKLEITFITSNNNENLYSIYLYNYKEIDEIIKYYSELDKQRKHDELEKQRQDSIIENKYLTAISIGDSLLKLKFFSKAKEQYNYALQLKPNMEYPAKEISYINDISIFLNERKTKIYSYEGLLPYNYQYLGQKIDEQVQKLINTYPSNLDFKLGVTYQIDTNGICKSQINIVGIQDKYLEDSIHTILKQIMLNSTYQNNYTVNAIAQYNFQYSQSIVEYDLKFNKIGISLVAGDENKFKVNQYLIKSEIERKQLPYGFYNIQFISQNLNNNNSEKIFYLKYKSFAGISGVFASLIIPGLGDRLVSGGAKFGFGKTIFVYSVIGAGVACKLSSNTFYSKYHSATNQTDIDSYYLSANNLNKASYLLIGTGVLVWLIDISIVAEQGTENKSNVKKFYQNINLSFNIDNKDAYKFGLTYKF